MLRILTLMAGLSGAFGAAQFPEYSQQYLQRLGGAVDELARQVDRHEREAAALGVSLDQMLVQLSAEGPLAERQAEHIRTDLIRHARLSADLQALQGAGPFMRVRLATHLGDSDVARRALGDYKPALPASFEGAIFATSGFVLGWLGLNMVFMFCKGAFGWLRLCFRRRA
ncbi:MAG: DUF2937 family protein [Pelagimonas sp.]|jgi:hypothetical protein|nr:DUF2937 family protein [Pelagimonas sp.]